MKRFNTYTLISIVTLVLMTVIFMRTMKLANQQSLPESPAADLLKAFTGNYNRLDFPSSQTFSLNLLDTLDEDGWAEVSMNDTIRLRIKYSDFEEDQILLEPFTMDSSGPPTRLDACEILLTGDSAEGFSGTTIGELCCFSAQEQTFQTLKIFLANSRVRVDIETWSTQSDSLIGQEVYSLEKEDVR